MAQAKSYSYFLYALVAVCVVLLAPYAGCHILTTKPQPEADTPADELGSAALEYSVDERGSATAGTSLNAPKSDETSNFDDIEKALYAK